MSLITRCPACGTMFKVVPDQLRISEGWVRCGHCAEVFDASTHMQPDAAPEAPMASSGPASPEVDTAPLPPQWPDEPLPPPMARPPAPVVHSAPDVEPALDPGHGPEPAPVVAPLPPAAVPVALVREVPADADSEDDPAEPVAEPAPGDTDFDHVPFVRQARRKAFWRRPLVRVTLGLVSLALLAVLVLQVAVQERDRLVASHPVLKPWLLAVCEPLRCTVGPPRQIDAIVIDASSFSKLRGEAYRLNFTLRNQAPIEIAMPSIELTLTDGQDQPVVRRVLAPADIGAARSTLPASGDWQGSFAMSVAPAAGAGRIAGYRVLAFYP
ncbi:MAG: DUF3426 domain-containing protein [Ramlibacter sp.]|nr:DUF3426 domain-containing protein [Ramlibacter sp.]